MICYLKITPTSPYLTSTIFDLNSIFSLQYIYIYIQTDTFLKFNVLFFHSELLTIKNILLIKQLVSLFSQKSHIRLHEVDRFNFPLSAVLCCYLLEKIMNLFFILKILYNLTNLKVINEEFFGYSKLCTHISL